MIRAVLLFMGAMLVGFLTMVLLVAEGERMEAERMDYRKQ